MILGIACDCWHRVFLLASRVIGGVGYDRWHRVLLLTTRDCWHRGIIGTVCFSDIVWLSEANISRTLYVTGTMLWCRLFASYTIWNIELRDLLEIPTDFFPGKKSHYHNMHTNELQCFRAILVGIGRGSLQNLLLNRSLRQSNYVQIFWKNKNPCSRYETKSS